MKLYLNKTSPYARLVMVVAHEKGLEKRIEPAWTDPWESPPALLAANPLSRVPALVTDSGVTIVDSTCICDYLDEVGAGRRLMPQQGEERLRTLRKYGLARGLIDAAFSVTIERRFHDTAVELPLADRWLAAIHRSVEAFDRDAARLAADGSPDLGDLALGVGLSYTEFRLPEVEWKRGAPRLSGWFDRLAARPSMKATAPGAL
jgi:glutathione S-transferase